MAYRETVLVTGAGGGVGTYLVRELLSAGYKVKATDLPGKPFAFGGSRVKEVRGDLTDRQFVEDLPYGVDHIIHAGAALDIGLPWEVLKAVNLDATVWLWEKAVECGIERFVFFSSASTYQGQDRPIVETDPQDPAGNYENSKFLAEKALLESKRNGAEPHLTMLRPALIIGPFSTALLAAVCVAPPILKHTLGFSPRLSGGPKTNAVHALDVARAALFVLKKGEDGEIYNVAHDDVLPFSEFFNVAAEEYGMTVLPFPTVFIPPKSIMQQILPIASRPELFTALNFGSGMLWKRLRKKFSLSDDLTPKIDKEMMGYAVRDSVFDAAKLSAAGFEYTFNTYRSAIRDVLDWYVKEKWIPPCS